MIEQTVTAMLALGLQRMPPGLYLSSITEGGDLPRCFSCRAVINTRDLFEVTKHEDEIGSQSGKTRISLQRIGAHSSAKIETLLTHLKSLRQELPGTKSVVFSQFTSFLSLIRASSYTVIYNPFLRLDGSNGPEGSSSRPLRSLQNRRRERSCYSVSAQVGWA